MARLSIPFSPAANKLSVFAATTSAELAGVISDETGTGLVVYNTDPALTRPVITGVVDGSSAGAGLLGQVITSTVLIGAPVSLTNGASKTITSITLTAGDWEVWGQVGFVPGSGTITNLAGAALGTTDNTFPTFSDYTLPAQQQNYTGIANANLALATGPGVQRVSGNTIIYLVAVAGFSVSTMSGYGFVAARRLR